MEKVTETLVDALKLALAEPGEQRLFKSGKLAGLFAGRAGVNAEAAARALRDGLLEVVRTEAKGKTTLEWVRITPRALEFLHQHESPVQVNSTLTRVSPMRSRSSLTRSSGFGRCGFTILSVFLGASG